MKPPKEWCTEYDGEGIYVLHSDDPDHFICRGCGRELKLRSNPRSRDGAYMMPRHLADKEDSR